MPVVEEKVNGNLKTVCYQESPIMSTYLVAVVVGLFDYVEDHTPDGTYIIYIYIVLMLVLYNCCSWEGSSIVTQELKFGYTAKLERQIKGNSL